MRQTSLKSDTLSQGKEAKNHTEKCRVSITFCQSYSVPQGNINKNHNVACPLTTYKRSQLREKWSSLSKQNSPAVNGAKCCVCVLNKKLTRSRQFRASYCDIWQSSEIIGTSLGIFGNKCLNIGAVVFGGRH